VSGGSLEIRVDDLTDKRVHALLRLHLETIAPTAPAESRHALDLAGLQRPDLTFWCMWDGDELAGFGALKELTPQQGEVKSMRTAPAYLRRGVAAALLAHITKIAQARGYRSLHLETGSMDFFRPARDFYRSFGFVPSHPFGDYRPDPNSVFMAMDLDAT
jgi:putative acetyltransferase